MKISYTIKTVIAVWIFLAVLAVLAVHTPAYGTPIKMNTEEVWFFVNAPLDTVGIEVKPDSVHITTWNGGATRATFSRSTTYPFSDVSIDTSKEASDTTYVFSDEIVDIDGTSGNFLLSIRVTMFGDALPTTTDYSVQIVEDSLNYSLTVASDTSLYANTAEIHALNDTTRYGNAVYVDDGANTNTVVGVDGLPWNPVGTIAAAKTIADAIGAKTIYFLEGTNETITATMEHYEFIGVGDCTDVTITLGGQDVDRSVFKNMVITGEQGGTSFFTAIDAVLNALDSLNICAFRCGIPDGLSLKAGRDSYFDQCYSAVPGNSSPVLIFGGAGAANEGVYFRHYSGGLRLRTMTSGDIISYESDGQLFIGADCNTSAVIVARGMMTINDSTAGANLTYTATAQYAVDTLVAIQRKTDSLDFGGQLQGLKVNIERINNSGQSANDLGTFVDACFNPATNRVLADAKALDGDTLSLEDLKDFADDGYDPAGDTVHTDILSDPGVSIAEIRAILDTLVYLGVVYCDTTNGTSGTTIGVHGTQLTPTVSISEAKTVADAIGSRTIVLVNNAGADNYEIQETMEGYNFVGRGDDSGIILDLNSQDVDGCFFTHLTIGGTQGGTGDIHLGSCHINELLLFAGHVENSWLSDSISMKANADIFFDDCQSAVPGARTPAVDLGPGKSNVHFRHYSGGLTIWGMAANDTLTYEAKGQLKIGTTNNAAKIYVRGMVDIIDDGTNTDLIYSATSQYAVDSTMNAITDANKENFKGGGGFTGADADSVLLYTRQVRDTTNAHAPHTDDFGSTTSSGPGAIPVRIYAYDSLNTAAVQGANIRINLPDGTLKHSATTGADGWASMTLAAGERYIFAQHGSYTFTTPACTLTVPADSLRDTVWATAFTPSLGSVSAELTNLYDYAYSADSTILAGAIIKITPNASDRVYTSSVTIVPLPITVMSDANGLWYTALYGTDSTTGLNSYNISITHSQSNISKTVEYKNIKVPANGGNTRLTTLLDDD